MRQRIGAAILLGLLLVWPAQAQMKTLELDVTHPCDGVVYEFKFNTAGTLCTGPCPAGPSIYIWDVESWLIMGNLNVSSNASWPGGIFWTCAKMNGVDNLIDQHVLTIQGMPSVKSTPTFARPFFLGPNDVLEVGSSCSVYGVNRNGTKLIHFTSSP